MLLVPARRGIHRASDEDQSVDGALLLSLDPAQVTSVAVVGPRARRALPPTCPAPGRGSRAGHVWEVGAATRALVDVLVAALERIAAPARQYYPGPAELLLSERSDDHRLDEFDAVVRTHASGLSPDVIASVRDGSAATTLADQANVTQARASQVLGRLERLGLVEKTGRGRWRPDREAMLDRFLAEYRGPGGTERYLYGLDSLTDVSIAIATSAEPRRPIALSADVGPDLLTAWRRPSVLVVYARQELDVVAVGLVDAQGPDDANVIVRDSTDLSVYPTPASTVELRGARVPLADPLQMIWDLHDLGGADREEAAGRLRQWLLTPA